MSLTFFSTTNDARGYLTLSLTVFGKPEPQGSVRAFVPTYKNGQPVRRADGSIVVNLTSDNSALKAWRGRLAQECMAEMIRRGGSRRVPTQIAVRVEASFFLQRPKAHLGTGRNAGVVKASAPAFPTGRPDVDKLLRALLDALTGPVFPDDAQVVEATARKVYCGPHDEPRVELAVWTVAP